MTRFRTLITDYAWPNLDIERAILSKNKIDLVVADKQDSAGLASLANGCDAIMTNWAKTTAEVIRAAKECKIVARLGIGIDNIDVAYCTEHKIPVTNCPDYCLIEVAEHALALILGFGRKVAYYHHETKQGRYVLGAGAPLCRMEGQTLGIVGLGNIGARLARKAQGIGLKVVATSRSGKSRVEGVPIVSLDELLSQSDYVSLHIPANAETKKSFSTSQFAKMKSSAYLINTARGVLIDDEALLFALEHNQISGAALDVQDPEPPDLSKPLFRHERVIVTPHAAFVSEESLTDLRTRVSQQVVDRLHGRVPENIVNGIQC